MSATRLSRRGVVRRWLAVGAVAATSGIVGVATSGAGVATAAVSDGDWLGIVNTYRQMSGLSPVSANATWSSQAAAHSCYMLENGITHDETPGASGYTEGGDTAGNSGNVAVSSSFDATPRSHIDLWMTGPFHAIGILRHNLATTGFGLCRDTTTPTPWHSGATLDVIRGLVGRARPSTPIVFPGDGATVPLTRFVTEFPNPMDMCGWSGDAGLPLIAMMPSPVGSAVATLEGPSGPIDTCVLHAGNVSDPTAKAILGGENAVVVMPRTVLTTGRYDVRVVTNGGTATWSFNVDPSAPLRASVPEISPEELPDTSAAGDRSAFRPVTPYRLVDSRISKGTVRLKAGTTTRIAVTEDPSVTAVSANFVAVFPEADGYLTAFNCTKQRPTVSSLNFRRGTVVANQAIVPLKQGDVCIFSKATTDIVIDVNGFYHTASGGEGYVAVTPSRLFDSRKSGTLRAGRTTVIEVVGVEGGAPAGAEAVALNVAAIDAAKAGWLKVAPCGTAGRAEISSLNYRANEVRPNSVVVPVDDRGRICVTSLRTVDVTVDLTGYFAGSGRRFLPLDPIRLFDSRSPFPELNPATGGRRVGGGRVVRLQIAGERGIPADAKAASLNIAATGTSASTFLTAYPCGARPTTASLNLSPEQATMANGAMVKLNGNGEVCIYTRSAVHVIVDVNGVWY
jgi:hypothetical protein